MTINIRPPDILFYMGCVLIGVAMSVIVPFWAGIALAVGGMLLMTGGEDQ